MVVLGTPVPDDNCCWAEKPRKIRIKMQQKYKLRSSIPGLTRMEWCFLNYCAFGCVERVFSGLSILTCTDTHADAQELRKPHA